MTGMVNMTLTSGATFQGASAIFAAVEGEFGWSRTLVSGVASFGRIGDALLGPAQGFLADRLGPGRVMLIGLTLGGAGFIFLSRIHSPVAYYAAYLPLSIGFSMGGFLPAMTAVQRWLPRNRAIGSAFVVGGSSIGGLTVPALVWGITHYGWRTTVAGIGMVAIASAPVFYRLLSRRAPAPSAPRLSPRRAPSRPSSPALDFTAGEALRTRAFWAISFSHMLANFSVAAISAHVLLYLKGTGMSLPAAASVVPVFALVGFAAQIAGGLIGDRVPKRVPISALLAVQASAVVVLAFAETYPAAMLFAVLWGIGFGGRTPMLHAMRGEYFGSRDFGTILGLSSLPMSIAMMAAPVAVGFMFDLQGTYRWAFLAVAALCYLGAALILLATHPAHPSMHRARARSAAA